MFGLNIGRYVARAAMGSRSASRGVLGQLGVSQVTVPVQISSRGFINSSSGWSDLKESAIISEKDGEDSPHIVVGDDGIPRNVRSLDDPPSEKLGVLIDKILDLDIIEMNQLLNRLQSRLGITDEMIQRRRTAGGAPAGGGEAAAEEAVVEKSAFDIKLTGYDPKSKIKIIKEVRAATGLGLKEAKDLVESAPVVVKEGLTKDEAEALNTLLTGLGGTVEVL